MASRGDTVSQNLRSPTPVIRASRQSKNDQVPFHLRHQAYKPRGGGASAQQAYVDRAAARDTVTARQIYVDRPVAADIGFDRELIAVGTLGNTPADRRQFWKLAEEIELRHNGVVQYGMIAELPVEVSPSGRLEILQKFGTEIFEERNLPYSIVAHRPDAHNDPRNFHAHVLYYARPGKRDPSGKWNFGIDVPAKLAAERFPWGTTEEPGKRASRMARQAAAAKSSTDRTRYEHAAADAQSYADAARRRRREARGGVNRKLGTEYPWGQEHPATRAARIQAQLDEGKATSSRIAWYQADLEEIRTWRSTRTQKPTDPSNITPRDTSWVAYLRSRWADACNQVLAAEGYSRRYNPGSYKSLGLDAVGTTHLGTKAALLDAQGVRTKVAEANEVEALRRIIVEGSDVNRARITAADETLVRATGRIGVKMLEAAQAGRTADVVKYRAEVVGLRAWRDAAAVQYAGESTIQSTIIRAADFSTIVPTVALTEAARPIAPFAVPSQTTPSQAITPISAPPVLPRSRHSQSNIMVRRPLQITPTVPAAATPLSPPAKAPGNGEQRAVPTVALLHSEIEGRRKIVRRALAEKHAALEIRPATPRHIGFPDRATLSAGERQRVERHPSFPAAAKLAVEIRNLRMAGQAVSAAADGINKMLPEMAAEICAKAARIGGPSFITALEYSTEFGEKLACVSGGQLALERLHQAFTSFETSATYLEAASKQRGLSDQNLNDVAKIRRNVVTSVSWLPLHPTDQAAGRDLAFFRAEKTLTRRFTRFDNQSIFPTPSPAKRQAKEAQNRMLHEIWRQQQLAREVRDRRRIVAATLPTRSLHKPGRDRSR